MIQPLTIAELIAEANKRSVPIWQITSERGIARTRRAFTRKVLNKKLSRLAGVKVVLV